MIILGTQYYRAPFPVSTYWEDDLKKMADSGLSAAQLWVKWGWVEPKPGEFRFDDYDRIIELADKAGVGVVLSTIAAIHPYWIHREVPDSEMVTSTGQKVVSGNRVECHYGLTPGGCFDHPGVWDRMGQFLSTVVTRYRSASNLLGWDAWNELRWNEQTDGRVCYCDHTKAKFRKWLDEKYGGLDGLNEAWIRRYASWEDVLPGKCHEMPYTEEMAFEHFLTWRACRHGQNRYDLMKALDPDHPVTVHGGAPSAEYPGWNNHPNSATALDRGNDWDFADHIDGIGTSSFPHWFGIDDSDFAARVGLIRSAAGDRARIWLSELQGGRASTGFDVHTPVKPDDQQRWIWSGISQGADTILFWCWRDEVFGRESAGFGMAGADGFADARLGAMAESRDIIAANEELLDAYKPAAGEVGVMFSPQSYYLHCAQLADARLSQFSLTGCTRALTRKNIPFIAVEEEHLDELNGLKVLFLPRTLVIDDHVAARLIDFVNSGGTIVCDSECGAFGSNGLYRYPQDRFLAKLTGATEVGRRSLSQDTIDVKFDEQTYTLPARQWLTPLSTKTGTTLAACDDGALAMDIPVGKGRVIMYASYMSETYYLASTSQDGWVEYMNDTYMGPQAMELCEQYEGFVAAICNKAGAMPTAEIAAPIGHGVHVQTGISNGKRMAFVFHSKIDSLSVTFAPELFTKGVRDVLTGEELAMTHTDAGSVCKLGGGKWGMTVLAEMP